MYAQQRAGCAAELQQRASQIAAQNREPSAVAQPLEQLSGCQSADRDGVTYHLHATCLVSKT